MVYSVMWGVLNSERSAPCWWPTENLQRNRVLQYDNSHYVLDFILTYKHVD